jgi:hypothetical protein
MPSWLARRFYLCGAEYRIFSNLIRTSFCRFLKRKKKIVRGSNPHLSFNRPLPTRQTDWIILDVTNALTVIRLTRRVWSAIYVTASGTNVDKRCGGVRWVSAAWKAIPESIIVRSFKKCCISNALDGSEDDILWEDDGEDKDDSDWVTDSDCYEWWRRVWWIINYKYYIIYYK